MAAAYQYDGLISAGKSRDYNVARRPIQLVGSTLDWLPAAVAASGAGSAEMNSTAMQVAGAMGRSGIEAQAMLGATALRGQSDLAATAMGASSSVFNAKTQADAMVEREKAARGSDTERYIKLAGGLGLMGLGLATA